MMPQRNEIDYESKLSMAGCRHRGVRCMVSAFFQSPSVPRARLALVWFSVSSDLVGMKFRMTMESDLVALVTVCDRSDLMTMI